MAPVELDADYGGGAPDRPEAIRGGTLRLLDSGAIDFCWHQVEGSTVVRKTAVLITPDEMLACSTGLDAAPRDLQRRIAVTVLAERDGAPFTALFMAARADVRRFASALRDHRAGVGDRQLPTIEAFLEARRPAGGLPA